MIRQIFHMAGCLKQFEADSKKISDWEHFPLKKRNCTPQFPFPEASSVLISIITHSGRRSYHKKYSDYPKNYSTHEQRPPGSAGTVWALARFPPPR